MLSKKQKDGKMNLTIEINGTFKRVEANNERGVTLLNNFIDGVIDAKELEYEQYANYLTLTTLATIK